MRFDMRSSVSVCGVRVCVRVLSQFHFNYAETSGSGFAFLFYTFSGQESKCMKH
jgi:hypothetical protein